MPQLVHVDLTGKILACCIHVHRELGPGFLEKVYEEAVCIELTKARFGFERQKFLPISYHGIEIGIHRLDLVIEGQVIVELKACKNLEDIHFATVLSYLKASRCEVALLLNFARPTLAIRRFARSILKSGFTADALKNSGVAE